MSSRKGSESSGKKSPGMALTARMLRANVATSPVTDFILIRFVFTSEMLGVFIPTLAEPNSTKSKGYTCL